MHRQLSGQLVIATHNPGKLAEMRELLAPHGVEAVSAGELGLGEPEETGDSFEANALIKARAAQALKLALGDADLTFTAIPVARDNESVRDRVMVIARNRGLAIHHITIHNLGNRLMVARGPNPGSSPIIGSRPKRNFVPGNRRNSSMMRASHLNSGSTELRLW